MEALSYLLTAFIGYLLGAVPFGYLVARAHGVDIFAVGSGNPGATNVRRVLGARAGNTVFALDALKGAAAAAWPVVLAWVTTRLLHPPADLPPEQLALFRSEAIAEARVEGLVGAVAAILGHSFSVFTKFKGGKGVATAAGGLVVLMPVSCAIGAAVWAVTFYATRYVSLGSILAALAVPTACWIRDNPLPLRIAATLIGLFVIYRHRENVRRLLNGTENRFGKKAG